MRFPVSSKISALAVVAGLVLTGCSGGSSDDSSSGEASSSSSASASTTPSPSSTVKVPDGVEVSDQGSKVKFGDPATVIFEPKAGRGSVLRLTVSKVQRGRLSDFKGFILDDDYKRKASYYYATVKVENVGVSNVGGAPVPLWGVNAKNTLLPAVNFTTSFTKCPSEPLPKKFGPGKSLRTCLVYLSPKKGALEAVSYRPSQEFNPITWTGPIQKPAAPKSKKATKKPAKKKG